MSGYAIRRQVSEISRAGKIDNLDSDISLKIHMVLKG